MSDRSVKQILNDVQQSISSLGTELSTYSTVMGLLSSGSVIRNAPIQSQEAIVQANLGSLKTALVDKVAHHLSANNPQDPRIEHFRQCLDSRNAVLGNHVDFAIRTHLREMLQSEHAAIEESLRQLVEAWMAKLNTLALELSFAATP